MTIVYYQLNSAKFIENTPGRSDSPGRIFSICYDGYYRYTVQIQLH